MFGWSPLKLRFEIKFKRQGCHFSLSGRLHWNSKWRGIQLRLSRLVKKKFLVFLTRGIYYYASFEKIMQHRKGQSITSRIPLWAVQNNSRPIPLFKISARSSGELVDMAQTTWTELKSFHCEILNSHEAVKQQQ